MRISGISGFTNANGLLYFEAQGNLWQTDGTEANTIEVPAAATLGMNGVDNLFAFNNDILFEGDNGAGDQLWILDTTSGVITQISNNAGTNADHDPSDYAIYGGFVYYKGESSDSTNGTLYRTDGVTTEQIDASIKDVDDLTVYKDLIYFEGEDINANLANELYVYNPATSSITNVSRSLIRMYPNPSTSGIVNFTGDMAPNSAFIINDLSGRMVLKGTLENNQLSHSLTTGIYFVELENIDSSFKLIVE